jgi:hypothetical protein
MLFFLFPPQTATSIHISKLYVKKQQVATRKNTGLTKRGGESIAYSI